MMFLIKSLLSIIKVLHSENSTNSIAFGAAFGFFLGLNPALSLQAVILLILSLVLSIQIGIMFISWALFSVLSLFIYLPLEKLGFIALSSSKLTSLWELLFNIPGLHFSLLNNSLVMGGFLISVLFFVPVFFLSKILLKKYRLGLGEKIENSHLIKVVKATKLYSLYESYSKLSEKVA